MNWSVRGVFQKAVRRSASSKHTLYVWLHASSFCVMISISISVSLTRDLEYLHYLCLRQATEQLKVEMSDKWGNCSVEIRSSNVGEDEWLLEHVFCHIFATASSLARREDHMSKWLYISMNNYMPRIYLDMNPQCFQAVVRKSWCTALTFEKRFNPSGFVCSRLICCSITVKSFFWIDVPEFPSYRSFIQQTTNDDWMFRHRFGSTTVRSESDTNPIGAMVLISFDITGSVVIAMSYDRNWNCQQISLEKSHQLLARFDRMLEKSGIHMEESPEAPLLFERNWSTLKNPSR
jgi:hypothetical protein